MLTPRQRFWVNIVELIILIIVILCVASWIFTTYIIDTPEFKSVSLSQSILSHLGQKVTTAYGNHLASTLTPVLGQTMTIFGTIQDQLNDIRAIQTPIRSFFADAAQQFYATFENSVTGLLYLLHRTRTVLNRSAATLNLTFHTLENTAATVSALPHSEPVKLAEKILPKAEWVADKASKLCFGARTSIALASGRVIPVSELKPNDVLADQSLIIAKHYFLNTSAESVYKLQLRQDDGSIANSLAPIYVTGSHSILWSKPSVPGSRTRHVHVQHQPRPTHTISDSDDEDESEPGYADETCACCLSLFRRLFNSTLGAERDTETVELQLRPKHRLGTTHSLLSRLLNEAEMPIRTRVRATSSSDLAWMKVHDILKQCNASSMKTTGVIISKDVTAAEPISLYSFSTLSGLYTVNGITCLDYSECISQPNLLRPILELSGRILNRLNNYGDHTPNDPKSAITKLLQRDYLLMHIHEPKLLLETGFCSGTYVVMGDGTFKVIEDVRPGDELMSAGPGSNTVHGSVEFAERQFYVTTIDFDIACMPLQKLWHDDAQEWRTAHMWSTTHLSPYKPVSSTSARKLYHLTTSTGTFFIAYSKGRVHVRDYFELTDGIAMDNYMAPLRQMNPTPL